MKVLKFNAAGNLVRDGDGDAVYDMLGEQDLVKAQAICPMCGATRTVVVEARRRNPDLTFSLRCRTHPRRS